MRGSTRQHCLFFGSARGAGSVIRPEHIWHGLNIFYYSKIAGKTRDEDSDEDIRAEEETSKAVLLLMNPDTNAL